LHLESLTLKGFKSFADRSVVSVERGVTAVVGPNGSGKSNISDAVLWVLGEQSAKALRGQAMEDVIFAGSSARQAVGVAEVDLVLDNSDHTLPIEFDQVTITRRMYRSGESEYLLNNTPVRLMDIHELLHDIGLGRDTHSIISQGQLDEVLNSKPEDRRALIEEAAGVLKHKKRKERAVRKLSRMDAHLERVKDITGEIDRQLRPLKRQAGRAQQHAEITSELKDLRLALAVDDLRTLQASWDGMEKREKEQDAEIELARYRLQEKERELEKFQALLEEKGLFVGDLSEQRRRLQSILERLNSGLLLLEEKGKNLVERLSDLRQKLHHSETRVVARSQELERLLEERGETDGRLRAHYDLLGELRREAETSKKGRMAADEVLSSLTGDVMRTRKELDDNRDRVAELDQSLSASRLEIQLLQERADAGEEDRRETAATLAARRTRLEQTEGALTMAAKDRALADAEVDKRVRVLDSRRRDLDAARADLAEARAEVRGLEEVDRAFASAAPGLALALARERDLPGIVAPLAELIDVAPEHEFLVERVLGSDLFALVVKDRSSARKVADSLADSSEGEVAVVPMDAPAPAVPEDAPGTSLVALIDCGDDVRPALNALLGDVRVVDSLSEAHEAIRPGIRVATRSGEVVWPHGKVTVGKVVSDSASVLARKRRLNELKDAIESLDSSLGQAELAVSAAEEALVAAQQDALELGQKMAALTGEADSIREDVGRLEQALTHVDGEADSITARIEDTQKRVDKEEPNRKGYEAEISRLEKALALHEENSAEAREKRDSAFREEAAINERLSSCQVEIATISEREIHIKRQISSITSEIDDLEKTIVQSRETEEALEILRERVQPVHDLYQALLERAEHWAVKLRDRARFEQADSESLRTTIYDAQDAVRDVQTEIETHNEAMSELRVEKGQMEVQVSRAVERIVEELGTPLETALAGEPLGDRQDSLDTVHRLEKRLENLGPVNPIAMQEYDSLQSRREFLDSQMEDLVASRKALSKIIAAIDRKIRNRFLETFEEVDGHFQEIFAILFPGGSSSLALTLPDDPENTGVEVTAQPPGKRLSKMSLLSGGEKSLTALALLFAVYRTRPCPFYILDEVEAALDDTNLRRFLAFVDSMRSLTQFLIVTHQRRTMEMADVLYGVSMQADGVSKVVSQKLEREHTAETEEDDRALV
jgi:chromosome segregation protein